MALKVLVVFVALLGNASASTLATLPGGALKNEAPTDVPDEVAALQDGEAAEAGSLAAGGEQGQSSLDLKAESEAGAGFHGDERSEASTASGMEEGEQVDTAFHAFMLKHSRDYQHGSEEYTMRKALFKQRLAAVHAHNTKPGRLWKATTSKFSDRTEGERKAVRGYKRGLSRPRSATMLQSRKPQKDLPDEKSWMHLKVAKNIRDQGSCGSCWAITTTSVLEAHYEIYSAKGGETKSFSPQQTLECTPNPKECGGQGGCEGATVELGMAWIVKNGVASEEEVPYTGEDGQCTAQSASDDQNEIVNDDPTSMQVLTRQNAGPSDLGATSIGLMSYHTLEQNSDYPLAEAVVQYGPVAVSAGAGSWFEYDQGVFDSCEPDVVVDHAITLYGYGKDQGVKYWHIRNSWGPDWGEHGFIRVLRHDDGQTHCGTDNDPSQGLGCKGGPPSVTVCGMCGILFDSVVPYFAGSPGHDSAGSNPDDNLVETTTRPIELEGDNAGDVSELDADLGRDPRIDLSKLRFQGDGEVAGLAMSDPTPATDAPPSLMRVEARPHH